MPIAVEKLLRIIREAAHCNTSCAECPNNKSCIYQNIAKDLVQNGACIPIECGQCTQYDPELGICKIRHDSYGSVLERGPHDWCSDGSKEDKK